MIQPGLERITLLLKNVHFPWKAIHVAGTNGKGSICAYASALLTRSNIRCGKFTSPHLIHRWDCISINDRPIPEDQFRKVENHFIQLNEKDNINASPFELLTATAFQIFNDAHVDIGVVEVGLGGTFDATNILNNQVICILSKIARDHQDFLGNTLEEIAKHKAGILRPGVPFAVNPRNKSNVNQVINEYAHEVGAGRRLSCDSPGGQLYLSKEWQSFAADLQPFQRDNAVLAYIAVTEALRSLEHSTSQVKTLLPEIRNQIALLGRFQRPTVFPVFGTSDRKITVDGAHNTDAAEALAEFVLHNERMKPKGDLPAPKDGWPVTWVFAMSQGRDPCQYFSYLLKPGDTVVTTSFGSVEGMPWVKSMEPAQLLEAAHSVQPGLRYGTHVPLKGALRALSTANKITEQGLPIVLTGSLYLVGEFYREVAELDRTWSTPEEKFVVLTKSLS